MLKIAITGVNGFVGSTLFTFLKKRGYDVIGFSRRKDFNEGIYFWDIASGLLINPPEVDVVVHCAGAVDDWATYDTCYHQNCIGTQNVLDTYPNIKKIIYISSCSVYDSQNTEKLIDESSPCGHFLNGYSRSKYEAEQIVLSHNGGSQKSILRPHIIYGAEDKKIIPRLLRAHRFGRFLVIGNGENVLSITHVDNLCLAVGCVVESQATYTREVFNISDDKALPVDDLIDYVKHKYGILAPNLYIPVIFAYAIGWLLEIFYRLLSIKKSPIISRYVVYQMSSDHVLSIKKAKNMLQYKPIVSIQDF